MMTLREISCQSVSFPLITMARISRQLVTISNSNKTTITNKCSSHKTTSRCSRSNQTAWHWSNSSSGSCKTNRSGTTKITGTSSNKPNGTCTCNNKRNSNTSGSSNRIWWGSSKSKQNFNNSRTRSIKSKSSPNPLSVVTMLAKIWCQPLWSSSLRRLSRSWETNTINKFNRGMHWPNKPSKSSVISTSTFMWFNALTSRTWNTQLAYCTAGTSCHHTTWARALQRAATRWPHSFVTTTEIQNPSLSRWELATPHAREASAHNTHQPMSQITIGAAARQRTTMSDVAMIATSRMIIVKCVVVLVSSSLFGRRCYCHLSSFSVPSWLESNQTLMKVHITSRRLTQTGWTTEAALNVSNRPFHK